MPSFGILSALPTLQVDYPRGFPTHVQEGLPDYVPTVTTTLHFQLVVTVQYSQVPSREYNSLVITFRTRLLRIRTPSERETVVVHDRPWLYAIRSVVKL